VAQTNFLSSFKHSEFGLCTINMPQEKIRKIGGGLGSNQIAGVVPAKLIDKKLILCCVKYRKK